LRVRFSKIRIVFLKELLDTIRDKRTIISMIVVPIAMMPLLMLGIGSLVVRQAAKAEKEVSAIVVEQESESDLVADLFDSSERFAIISVPEPDSALMAGQVHLIVEVSEGFDSRIDEGEIPELGIKYDSTNDRSEIAFDRATDLLESLKDSVVVGRIEDMGLSKRMLDSFDVVSTDVATKEKVGGRVLGMVLPMLAILLAMVGGTYPAIDLTAGEKDRSTLETLLVSPASRLELVCGKFLVVLLGSLTAALLAVSSMTLTLRVGVSYMFGGVAADQLAVSISPGAVGVIVLLSLPMAILFSSLLVAVGTYARTYKEAQSYISPLYFAIIVPAYAAILPATDLTPKLALIPVANISLAFKEALMGRFDWQIIAVIFLSTAVYSILAMIFAARLFQREEVLFRV
jgi:sodium transport system permease protein